MSQSLKDINYRLLIVLAIIFIYLLIANINIDASNRHYLSQIPCHKEMNIPDISFNEQLKIESIIEKYWIKRRKNKSNYAKIISEIQSGILRGICGGFIMGGGIQGAVTGAITYGSISGIMRSYSLYSSNNSTSTVYLMVNKPT